MISARIRIYALGAPTLGVVGLIWGDFALAWLPVSPEFPAARRWRICSQRYSWPAVLPRIGPGPQPPARRSWAHCSA
jgi:hypothetical protein